MARAKLLGEKGDRAEAYGVGQQAITLYQDVLARDPADIQGRGNLAHLFHQLATLSDDRENARSAAERSNKEYRALLRKHGEGEQAWHWFGGIAMNLHNIGHNFFLDAQATNGPLKSDLIRKAIDAFEEAREVCEARIQEGHQDDGLISLLGLIERYLCRSCRFLATLLSDPAAAATRMNEASRHGERAVLQFEDLVNRNPDHFPFSWELVQTLEEVGLYHLDTREWEAMVSSNEMARATLKKMARTHGNLVSRIAQYSGGPGRGRPQPGYGAREFGPHQILQRAKA